MAERPLVDSTPLTVEAAEAYLAEQAFHTGMPGFVRAEVERLLRWRSDPTGVVDPAAVRQALAAAGHQSWHGRLTFEPGGAVEVSSPPSLGVDDCLTRTASDLVAVETALKTAGILTVDSALDPVRSPHRVVYAPRYDAMERFFDRDGDAGRWMMCSTASVQVCVDAGHESGPLGFRRRWALAHAIGPVLVAAFANSPLRSSRPTGWRSSRQAVWQQLDPSRTFPPSAGDPREAWARYTLDASVMCIRDDTDTWAVPQGLTFRQWLQTGQPRQPTLDDLDYHVTTLFPPVRPRGYLELRMIDGQAGGWWVVPIAVVAGLFGDAVAGDEAFAATERLHATTAHYRSGPCSQAARYGLRDPLMATAALEVFLAAYAALARQDVTRPVREAVAAFIERYVSRGRTPADDLLEALPERA